MNTQLLNSSTDRFGIKQSNMQGQRLPNMYNVNFPMNQQNPYDYVGQGHNAAIDYIVTNYETAAKQIKAKSIREMQDFIKNKISEFCRKMYGTTTDLSAIDRMSPSTGLLQDTNFDDYRSLVAMAPVISNAAKQRLCSYLQTLSAMPLVSNNDINNFTATVISFENSYSPIDNQSDPIILSSLAIAKYSAYYWRTVLNQNSTPPEMKWWCVAADIVGGILCSETVLACLCGAAAASEIVNICYY